LAGTNHELVRPGIRAAKNGLLCVLSLVPICTYSHYLLS
jgi:hypothetical protein